MKKSFLVSLLVYSLTYGVNNLAISAEIPEKSKKPKEKVAIKCYVELFGGEKVIHQMVVKKKKVSGIENKLAGRKIRTTTARKKQEVYKVHECVDKALLFSKSYMNDKEKNTAW